MDTEKRKKIVETLLKGGFWFTDCEPPLDAEGNIVNFENFRLLKAEFDEVPDEDFTLERIYRIAINLRNGGHLIRKTTQVVQVAPTPVEPALNLPDPDEPLLKNLRCLEDIKEHGYEISKKVSQQGGGAGGRDAFGRSRSNPLLEKLDRRLKYIQENKIRLADLIRLGLEKAPGTETPQPKPIFTAPPEISEAHGLVDAMNLGNIGTTSSNMGRHTLLANRKERFHKDINEAYANRESAKKILQDTKDKIKKSGESSIS